MITYLNHTIAPAAVPLRESWPVIPGPPAPPPQPPAVELTDTAAALLAAGPAAGAECCLSPVHPLLQTLAARNAAQMARIGSQGHRGFNARFQQVYQTLGLAAYEIEAQSWDWQMEAPLAELGEEMFKSWKQSRGHWRIASVKHLWIGLEMAKGRKRWYGTILCADRQ